VSRLPAPLPGPPAVTAGGPRHPDEPIARWSVPLVVLAGVGAAVVAVAVVRMGAAGYRLEGSSGPGLATSLASALGRLLVVGASTTCTGALVTAAFLRLRRGPGSRSLGLLGDPRTIRVSAWTWAATALALVAIDAADVNGLPVGILLQPGAGRLVAVGYLPRAWIVSAVCAVVIAVSARVSWAWQTLLALHLVAFVGLLAPVLVGDVLVGPDHDFMGGVATLATPAEALWFGATFVLVATWRRSQRPQLLRRYGVLALVCAPLLVAQVAVLWVVQTETRPGLATLTGRLFCAQAVLLGILAALGIAWRRGRAWERPARAYRLLVAAAATMAAFVVLDVVATRVPPPSLFAPSTITQNFLGYDVTPAPTFARLVGYWRPDLLFLPVSIAAVTLYLVGVTRVRRRGDAWPPGRTVAWLAGWAVVVFTTSSGVGRYAGASFSVHMALHMTLNMFAPVLLVLGGPITLALRALPAAAHGQPDGPREWVSAMLGWRFVQHFLNPLHAFAAYTVSYFALYFTNIFEQASHYHWAHELMDIEFLAVGYLFFTIVVGVDHLPRELPHLGRLGLTFATMPFHAFFGVVIMMSNHIIAGTFYTYLASGVPWITDLAHDQYVGGGIAWAAGEIPLLLVVITLVSQWARQDARRAARADRQQDTGLDDTFDAYNVMLARLAERDHATTTEDTR